MKKSNISHGRVFVRVMRRRFDANITAILDDDYIHILGGYFNCSQNNQKDRDPKQYNNDQCFKELDDLMNFNEFKDIYRKRYPNKKTITFSRGNSKSRHRLFSDISNAKRLPGLN